MEVMPMRHKHSMSDSPMGKIREDCLSSTFVPGDSELGMGLDSCVETNYRQCLGTEVQKTLKQEILQLQEQLEDQCSERSALEKALKNESFHHDPTNKNSISKHAESLKKEISILEFEVACLEKYLLSLYRKRFQERISSLPQKDQSAKSGPDSKKLNLSEFQDPDISIKEKPFKESSEFSARETFTDSRIYRSHSSLSHRFDRSCETGHKIGVLPEDVNPYHSMPLSMLEHAQGDYKSNSNSLGEYLQRNIWDDLSETPNWISEEMIRTISSIYIELVDPPLMNRVCPSFSSPISDSSPNKWNLNESINSGFPSSSVVEVQSICSDSGRLQNVKQAQYFRSLISRLEKVDLKRMKHEEKVAFWINVHNALVMHAYLVHGVSQNSTKRIYFVLKAAYNVGGHATSVDMIQNSILGCRLPRPGQWIHSLFFPKTKFKVKDARRAYAIEHPEPRLYFALCLGSHSDPSVRLYTPKSIFQDLEASKEDYIQGNLTVNKQGKIILPKIVDLFAKESSLCPSEFTEVFEYLVPPSPRKNKDRNFLKRIQWAQHNFAFRFMLSKELIFGI